MVGMWADNETARDFLNFTRLSDTVAEIIVQAQRRSVSIGVSGAWGVGVGKSSMVGLIRRALALRVSSIAIPRLIQNS
jgi:predicted KAP-like P-loop ATPase